METALGPVRFYSVHLDHIRPSERLAQIEFLKDRVLGYLREGGAVTGLSEFGFPENKGPEALARHPETGALYVFAEHALNENGNHRGFLVSGTSIDRELELTIRNHFSITDAVFLKELPLL